MWLDIEESIIKQKSRVYWLQIGEENTAYFHASLKNRISHTKICSVIRSLGERVTTTKDIEEKIIGFYKQLLGTCASH